MKKTVLYSLVFYSAVIAPFADAREISYRYFFHEQMTAQEACDRAKREIKRQALSRELGEVIQSQSFQQCTDREGQMNRCDTYTDVLAMTELGFVKSFEVLEKIQRKRRSKINIANANKKSIFRFNRNARRGNGLI